MLTTTHLAVAVLLGMLMNLDRDEWFVALTFGLFLDIDHLFAAPRYVSDNGWGALLAPTWEDGSGLPWKSAFHHPEGAFIVGYLSVGWRLCIPLLFWGSHLALDELQLATLDHSAIVESAVLAAALGGILWVGYWRWSRLEPGEDFLGFLRHLATRISSVLSPTARKVRRRSDTT
ncbi:MAG: hypothetical protein QXQ13_01355 [Thermoplasmata archaeon]